MSERICPGCGDSYGSRYHEVAHQPDVSTASLEDLQAAAEIYDRAVRARLPESGKHDPTCKWLCSVGVGCKQQHTCTVCDQAL